MNPTEERPSGTVKTGSTAQRLEELPYSKRVCRMEHYRRCLNEPPPPARDSDREQAVRDYAELASEMGFEVQVVQIVENRGTPRFPSKMLPPHPNLAHDPLPFFLELAHQKGMLVLGYWGIRTRLPLKRLHPDWMCVSLDDGRPPIENIGWPCLNSPYRDWTADHMIECLDNLDVDGFYFDGTRPGIGDERPLRPACCCPRCEKLFRDETGLQLPHKVDFDSTEFRQSINWRYKNVAEFLNYIARRVRERHAHTILDFNSYYRPDTTWSSTHPVASLHLEDSGALFFTETFRSLREPGLVAKIMRATGTPFGLFRNLEQVLPGFERAMSRREPYSPAVFGCIAIANGSQPCGDPFGDPPELQKEMMKGVFAQFKKRRDYIEGETVKYLGLHLSQQNRDFRPSEIPRNSTFDGSYFQMGQLDVNGAYEILNRSHLLLDIVFDEHLTRDQLSRYSVLFLSNSACLSAAQCLELSQFVQAGGTLIATHQTSLLDEWGQPRDNFALAELFGVDYQGSADGDEDHTIFYVSPLEHPLPDAVRILCLYGKESAVSLRPDAELQILCTRARIEPEKLLAEFEPDANPDTGEPAVVLHPYGKGQAIYIGADLGGAYMNQPYPLLRRFVAGLVERTQPPITFHAPEAVEVTAAFRGSNELMVHLVNNPTPVLPWRIEDKESYNRDLKSYFYLHELNPIRDIAMQFHGFELKGARLPLQDRTLEVTHKPDTVVLPELELHEVVLLELDK